jgi:serine/threonine protein kinase
VLDANGTVKIIDFGLSTYIVPGQLLCDFCGAPEYAAPEVLREIPHEGAPIDIWAIGVILFDMVVGHLPFDPPTDSPDLLHLDGVLTPELQTLLRHILNENPKKRATTVDIRECAWMNLCASVCIGENFEMDVGTTNRATVSLASSSLYRRMSLERQKVLIQEMGFALETK